MRRESADSRRTDIVFNYPDLRGYNLAFRTLTQLAASPDETRDIITAAIRSHRRSRPARSGPRASPKRSSDRSQRSRPATS